MNNIKQLIMKNWSIKYIVGAGAINIPLGIYNDNIIGRIKATPLICDNNANIIFDPKYAIDKTNIGFAIIKPIFTSIVFGGSSICIHLIDTFINVHDHNFNIINFYGYKKPY